AIDSNLCSDTASETLVLTSVIQVNGREMEVKLYPNPARSNATIEFDLLAAGKVNVQLFDVQGKLIYQSEQQNLPGGKVVWPLDLSRVAPGQYMVRLNVGSESTTFKLIRTE